jgi:hypothetical protein
VRGIGNPVQTLLVLAGVVPFEPFDGPLAIAWYRWLLLDALLFSPWFMLGGLAFGATAWPTRRPGSASAARRMVTEGQQA